MSGHAEPSSAEPQVELSKSDLETVGRGGTILIGSHRVVIERDLVDVHTDHSMLLPEVSYLLRIFETVHRLHGRFFLLARNSSPMRPETRQYVGTWGRTHPVGGVAIVDSGNRVANALLSMVGRALSVLRKSPFQLRFYATESQARAWIDELRRQQP